jgi:hypothetical protein
MADHVLKSIKPKVKGFDEAEATDACLRYITEVIAVSNCRRLRGISKQVTKCTCMRFLANPDEEPKAIAVAEYMVRWAGMSLQTKREVVLEWLKVSALLERLDPKNKLTYMLPGLPPSVEGEEAITICKNATGNLLSIGRKLFATAGGLNALKPDGKKGRTGTDSNKGKYYIEIYDSLHDFFVELEKEGLQFSTRIIREETGTTTRDDNPEELVLPPHISKRSCYGRWCYSRGWNLVKKSSAKTTYAPVKEYEGRPNDDDAEVPLWPTGSVQDPVVTWPTFLNYWKKNFGHLKIRKKGADTCTDCQILCQEFRMSSAVARRRVRRRLQQEARVNAGLLENEGDRTESEDEDEIEDEIPPEAEIEAQIERMDEAVTKAREHVRQYQVQRHQARLLIESARNDVTYNLPSLFRRKVLTIDMGQNLCLPNFEAEQPGDTYYFSPLTVLLFGVVDNATEDRKDRMNAFIWREFDGARGANNIASCLLKDLKLRGCFRAPNFGELTYIADNCGGQNKNKVVIRFLMWLVENRIFPQVKIHFLVKGHTKNAADRMFNLLKLSYHKKNIYTYDQLKDILNENEFVDVHKMTPGDFHDHNKWQDMYYRRPTGGAFKQSHVFTMKYTGGGRSGPTVIFKQDDNDAEIRLDNLKPTLRSRNARVLNPRERAEQISKMEEDLEELIPQPLRPIKQVELWSKWAPLIPEDVRHITCPKPSDEVIASIKSDNREKSKKRAALKKHNNQTGLASKK